MKYPLIRMYGYLCLSLLITPVYTIAKTVSWRANNIPSLKIVDKVGVLETDSFVMAEVDAIKSLIRIEDIIFPKESDYSEVFVHFNKTHYSSYIVLRVFDVKTEEELCEVRFDESGCVSLDQVSGVNRVYFTVEIFGEDINLYTAGINLGPKYIMKEQDFVLSTSVIYQYQNDLGISIQTREAANISLFIYDRDGNICHELLNNKILNSGFYEFSWSPRLLSRDIEEGELFYVWVYLTNFQSKDVSYLKSFFVIP